MRSMPARSRIDRRTLLKASALMATGLMTGCAARARSWIPSEGLLSDLPDLMARDSVPGLALAAIEDGALAWSGAFGLANLDTRAPVTAETMFEAASMSKPVFAYVVIKLAEEGVIDLDQPLSEYYRPEFVAPHPWVDRITPRHALSHTSGLPKNWREDPAEVLTLVSEPGQQWLYSGEGYVWLQRAVERATGKGLSAIMHERLLAPAGMRDSTFAWTEERARRQAYGHIVDEDGRTPKVAPLQYSREVGDRFLAVAERWGKPASEWTFEDSVRATSEMAPHTNPILAEAPLPFLQLPYTILPNSAGSLGLTIADYARFTMLMMPHEQRAAWELSSTGLDAMLTPEIVTDPPSNGWGLGWSLDNGSGSTQFWHSGNNSDIFLSLVAGEPARKRALIAFTNGANGERLARTIFSRVMGT